MQLLLECQVPNPARPTASNMRREHKQPMRKGGQHVQPCDRKMPTQLRRALSVSREPRCQWRRQARDKTTCAVTITENRASDDANQRTYGHPLTNRRAFVSASENFEDFRVMSSELDTKCGHTARLHPHMRRRVRQSDPQPKLDSFQTSKEVWLATALKLAPPRMGQRKL